MPLEITKPEDAVGFYADCCACCFPKPGVRVRVDGVFRKKHGVVVSERDGAKWDVAFDTLSNFGTSWKKPEPSISIPSMLILADDVECLPIPIFNAEGCHTSDCEIVAEVSGREFLTRDNEIKEGIARANKIIQAFNEHDALVAVADAAEVTLGMCDHVSALNGGGKNAAGEAMRSALAQLAAVRKQATK